MLEPEINLDIDDDECLDAYTQHLKSVRYFPDFPSYLPGIKATTKPPRVLFACKEAYDLFSKRYTVAFRSLFSVSETYLDFERDTSLNYDFFTFHAGQSAGGNKGLVLDDLGSLCHCEDLAKSQKSCTDVMSSHTFSVLQPQSKSAGVPAPIH